MEDHCIDWNREARTDEESKRLLGTAQINPFLATQRGVYGAGIDPPTGRDRTTLEIDGVPGLQKRQTPDAYNEAARRVEREQAVALIDAEGPAEQLPSLRR